MSTVENVAAPSSAEVTVRSFFDSFAAGEMDKALALLAPDCVVDEAQGFPFAGRHIGPEGFAALARGLNETFEIRIEKSEWSAGITQVVGRITLSFTSRVTGRRVDTRILESHKVENGLIQRIDCYYKDPGAVRALAEEK